VSATASAGRPNHKDRGEFEGSAAPGTVALRPFPYPYRSALALSVDVDDLRSRDEFVALMEYLNTSNKTRLGPGLDLEVGSSIWLYDGVGTCDFTVFRGLGPDLSEHAPTIESFVRAGLVDTLHTYGDFSDGGFRRELADTGLRYLSERGLTFRVWVNHGGDANTQMIGPRPCERGDDPGAPEYHTDLLVAAGLRFVEKFEIVHTIGQDAPPSPRDRLTQLREIARYALALGQPRARSILANRLLEPCTLGDGRRVYSFKRFIGPRRGLDPAGMMELPVQIAPGVLDELESKEGAAAVYTHLWRRPRGANLVPPAADEALRDLAARAHAGRIHVTTLRRLLTWSLLRRFLVWECVPADGGLEIVIRGVRDPVFGSWVPERSELAGLTFLTGRPEATRMTLGRSDLGPLVVNPPDASGLPSVSLPLERAIFPELH